MQLIPNQTPTFQVEMTKQELEFIQAICQNPMGDESPTDKDIRKNLFVGASRILGYDMNDDGSINRSVK